MNKCVYLHKFNGIPFYVGRGTLTRAYKLEKSKRINSGTYRGDEYSAFVEDCGFNIEVEIVKAGLTEEQAADLELEMYHDLLNSGITLTNKRPPVKEKLIDRELMLQHFKYDEESKTGLLWLTGRRKGLPAGSKSTDTWRVCLHQQEYFCSRIICTLFGFDVKGKVVDHENGDGFDNRIQNLRVVTQQSNMLNCKKKRHNTTGVTGVSYITKKNAYRAYYVLNGKTVFKDFCIDNLGKEVAFEMACNFRKDGVSVSDKLLKEAGEHGYSYRHGEDM